VAKAEEKNNWGFYWSSSPLAEPSPLVRNLKISNSTVDAEQFSIPAYGYSVRCFKNEYSWTWDKFTITFDFNGWSGSTAAIHVVSWEKAIEPSEPVKWDKEFLWRFLEWSNTPFDFEEIAITWDITLYAVYSTTVTYNLNWWYWTEEGTSSTLPKPVSYGKEVTTTNWKTPSKQWYMFDWWYVSTESNASRWTWNIENDITVYARWLPFNEKEVVINGVSFKIMDRNLW
jgi:hypothetical protein